jgi:cysteine desulfurase / selenocysteine lyase
VALTHCSNVTGVYAPVKEMAALAKEAGAVTVVDAAQSAPHRRLELEDVDFVTFSAHKMLGPTGVGVLCGDYERLDRLEPYLLGGGVVDWVDLDRYELRRIPQRFEAGTPNIGGVYGLGAALAYLGDIGHAALAAHDRALARRQLEEALARPYLSVIGPTSHRVDRAATLSVAVRGTPNLKEIARILSDSYGVMCRTGHMCAQPLVDRLAGGQVLRMSTYLYNTVDEIRGAFAALDAVCARMGLGPSLTG